MINKLYKNRFHSIVLSKTIVVMLGTLLVSSVVLSKAQTVDSTENETKSSSWSLKGIYNKTKDLCKKGVDATANACYGAYSTAKSYVVADYKVYTFDNTNNNKALRLYNNMDELREETNGKRVLVIVHGFCSQPSELLSLAETLEKAEFEGQPRYDMIVLFSYGNGTFVQGNEKSAQALRHVLENMADAQSVEFVCHSNGGLVLREALREPSQVTRWMHRVLFLGTPHRGVAAYQYLTKCLGLLSPTKAIFDLIDGNGFANPSSFLTRLNEYGMKKDDPNSFQKKHPIVHATREYHILAGNSPKKWQGTKGEELHSYFNAQQLANYVHSPFKDVKGIERIKMLCDGLVPVLSALAVGDDGSDLLRREAHRVLRTVIGYNHSQLAGTEGTLESEVAQAILKIVNNWSSNVYDTTIQERASKDPEHAEGLQHQLDDLKRKKDGFNEKIYQKNFIKAIDSAVTVEAAPAA